MAYRTTAIRLDRDQALRQRIVACALERVAEGGFSSLTMQNLAEDVGIATGSLYRHFSGKGSLAATVFTAASHREVDALAGIIQVEGNAAQRLRAGLERFAERAWNSRQLAFALIAEPVEPEVDEQRLRFREAYADLFAQLLRDGMAEGVFLAQPVNLVSACLVGAIAEALVGPLSPQARADREAGYPTPSLADVSQALVTFCLRAVGAKEAM